MKYYEFGKENKELMVLLHGGTLIHNYNVNFEAAQGEKKQG